MVSGSLSATEGSERVNRSAPLYTYSAKFDEVFPYYLSIGMTYDQFWNGDCTLVIPYRKADKLQKERKNQELWLQGLYIYEAILDVSPVLHAFAKKGTKPKPYSSAPYPITNEEMETEKVKQAAKTANKGKKYMEALMSSNNKKFGTERK